MIGGTPFAYYPPGLDGIAGSRWYAPYATATPPVTDPIASGNNALAAGDAASATGNAGIALGESVLASGVHTLAVLSQATASADYAIALGFQAVSSGANGSIAIGRASQATAGSALALGQFATAAQAASIAFYNASPFNTFEMQRRSNTNGRDMRVFDGCTTTNAVATNMTGITLPTKSACAVRGQVAAYRTAGAGTVGDVASWDITALVSNVGGTVTLIGATLGAAGSPTFNDAGMATCLLAAAIVSSKLTLQATGQAGETIRWEANLTITSTA